MCREVAISVTSVYKKWACPKHIKICRFFLSRFDKPCYWAAIYFCYIISHKASTCRGKVDLCGTDRSIILLPSGITRIHVTSGSPTECGNSTVYCSVSRDSYTPNLFLSEWRVREEGGSETRGELAGDPRQNPFRMRRGTKPRGQPRVVSARKTQGRSEELRARAHRVFPPGVSLGRNRSLPLLLSARLPGSRSAAGAACEPCK